MREQLFIANIRVEYDDGDMGWVADLKDESKVKFLEGGATDGGIVPLMAAVATPVAVHAGGKKDETTEGPLENSEDKASAVSFNEAPPVQLPAGAGE